MAAQTGRVVDQQLASGGELAIAWRRLALRLAIIVAVAHIGIGALYRDVDAVALALVFGVGLGLTRVRRGTVGLVVLLLAFANITFWMVPAFIVNTAAGQGFTAEALPGVLAVLAAAGLVATIASLRRRRLPTADAGRTAKATVVAGAGILIVLSVAALPRGSSPSPEPDDHVVVTDTTAFTPRDLVVDAGSVSIYVENRDYFWHTFTVRELGIDVLVPVGGSERVTVEVPAGTYAFVCAVPGHEAAGMTGTLTAVGG